MRQPEDDPIIVTLPHNPPIGTTLEIKQVGDRPIRVVGVAASPHLPP